MAELADKRELNEKKLNRVVNNLTNALEALDAVGVEDYRILSRYAEYLVAQKLIEEGHEIQIGGEREDKKADIYFQRKS